MIISRLLVCWNRVNLIEDENLFGFYKRKYLYAKKIDNQQTYGLSNSIISILRPLTLQFKGKIVESLADRWDKNNLILRADNFFNNDINYENTKVLELILHLGINQVDFLKELAECSLFKRIHLVKHRKQSNKKVHVMNRKDARLENNLLSFLYCYLKYSHFHERDYHSVYHQVFRVLYLFENSFYPSTLA